MPTASWLIGAYPHLPEQTLTVDVTANESLSVAAGSYYLHDAANSALSLLNATRIALNTHSELGGTTANICRDRLVRITTNQSAEITWPPLLRTLFGMPEVTVGSDHVAEDVSPLLWSPGKPESPAARLGSDGFVYSDVAVSVSATSVVTSVENNTGVQNSFEWPTVLMDRVWTEPRTGGTYESFFATVLRRFRRFKLWRAVTEDASDATVTWGEYLPSTGAYVMRPDAGTVSFDLNRREQYVESYADVDLDVIRTTEFV